MRQKAMHQGNKNERPRHAKETLEQVSDTDGATKVNCL